jgi:hypothetical protein
MYRLSDTNHFFSQSCARNLPLLQKGLDPQDDTYFIQNVSILPGKPIPFFLNSIYPHSILFTTFTTFSSFVYTHMDQIYKKVSIQDGPIDPTLHTDYCQISDLPIVTPLGHCHSPTGIVAITLWLSVAITETVLLPLFAT